MDVTDEYTMTLRAQANHPPVICYDMSHPIDVIREYGGGKSSSMISEELSPTLCTTHQGEPAVCYGLDRASYNQGQNALFDFSVLEEQQPTLTAKGPGGVAYLLISEDSRRPMCHGLQMGTEPTSDGR